VCYTLVLTADDRAALDTLELGSVWNEVRKVLFGCTTFDLWWAEPVEDLAIRVSDDKLQQILELAESVNFDFPLELGDTLIAKLSNLMLQTV
jgi:hypothetical protein